MLHVKRNTGNSLFILFLILFSGLPLSAQVSSDFTHFTPGDSCGSRSVQFDATASGGNITEYNWKFTDLSDGSSLGEVPGNTAYRNFLDVGSYEVKLIVKDAADNTDSSSAIISVYESPTADFIVNAETGCAPHEVTFTDNSVTPGGDIVNWEWDYNDGQKDVFTSETQAVHSYSGLKKYSPTLIITDENGCRDSKSGRELITVYEEITPSFTVTDNNSCSLPHTVTFSNNSKRGDFYAFEWDFGNGTTLTTEDTVVTQTYTTSGTFEVNLTAVSEDDGCSNTKSTSGNDNVSIGIPVTNFDLPVEVCQGEELVLEADEDASGLTNTGTWVFEDDGSEVTGLNASHVFNAPGVWDVKFVAYNSFSNCLSDTITKSLEVILSPEVSFSGDVSSACQLPVEVNFTNNSSGAIRYEWDFKDGSTPIETTTTAAVIHTFTAFGNYDVKLTAYNNQGCSATETLEAISIQQPEVNVTLVSPQFCESVPFNLRAVVDSDDPVSSYEFEFNEGTVLNSGSPGISHLFEDEGEYSVMVSVITQQGCTATSGSKNFTVKEYCSSSGNDTSASSVGPVKVSKPDRCGDKYTFVFEDTSNVNIVSWDLDGDVINASTNPLTYTFTKTDSSFSEYLVTLNATDASNRPVIRKFAVEVVDEQANYAIDTNSICRGEQITFTPEGITPQNIEQYSWDFGNGSALRNINNNGGNRNGNTNYQYSDTGSFEVQFRITDVYGCRDSISGEAIHVTAPEAFFTMDTSKFCSNNFEVVFTDGSETNGAGEVIQRSWGFGDGTSYTSPDTFAIHTFSHNQAYRNYGVTLSVTNEYGCSSDYTANVQSYQPKADFISSDQTVCGRLNVSLSNRSQARVANNSQYTWYYGDGTQSNGFNATHAYPDTGSYTVSLKVVDDGGCVDSTGIEDYINLVQAIADFSIAGDTTKCAGTFALSMESTGLYASNYNWSFGDGTISGANDPQASHVYEEGGIFEIMLVVSGQGFCRDTARKSIRIKGPGGDLIIPDKYICLGGDTLNAFIDGNDIESYYWDFGDFTNTSAFRNSSEVTHYYSTPGQYQPSVILLGAEDCQITLPNRNEEPIMVYVDELEAGDSLNIECADPYITLEGETALNIAGNYYWSGPVTDYQPDNSTLTARVNTAGMYYLNTLDTLCNVRDSVVVTTSGIQPVGGAGPNLKIDCIDSIATLGGFTTTANTKFQWYGPDDNVFTNGSDTLLNPVVRDSGIYALEITQKDCILRDTLRVDLCSLSAVDTLLKFCANQPGVPFSYAGYDLYDLNTYVSDGISSYVSWFRDPEFTIPVENPSSAILENGEDVYAKIVSLDNTETARAKTDWVVYSYVSADINYESDTLCETDVPLYLDAEIYLGEDITYTWYYNGIPLNPFRETLSLVNPGQRGQYVLEVSNPYCSIEYDTVDIMIYENPEVYFEQEEISLIYETDEPVPIPLIINTGERDPVTSISWDPTDYLRNSEMGSSVSDIQNPIYVPQNDEFDTDYRAVVTTGTGENACEVEAYILVHNYKIVNIPNAFSPNGDGLNDTWIVDGLARFPETKVRIFNRWGELVYEDNAGYRNPWNGTANGSQLPFGTYFYVLDFQGSTDGIDFTSSGSLTIFR